MKYDYDKRCANVSSDNFDCLQWSYEDKRCDDRKEYKEKDDYKGCPKPSKLILECGTNPQDAIFEIDDDEVEDDQVFTLDTLYIDTSCLCKPQVKIEFSSIIYFEAESETGEDDVEVELLFELVRICKGEEEEVIRRWRYLKEFDVDGEDVELEISEPFTVTYCDRSCPGCCKYKMRVRGVDFDGDFEALRVVQPDLSALAQGLCGDKW